MRLPSLFLEKAGSSHHEESAMVTSVLVPSSVGSMVRLGPHAAR